MKRFVLFVLIFCCIVGLLAGCSSHSINGTYYKGHVNFDGTHGYDVLTIKGNTWRIEYASGLYIDGTYEYQDGEYKFYGSGKSLLTSFVESGYVDYYGNVIIGDSKYYVDKNNIDFQSLSTQYTQPSNLNTITVYQTKTDIPARTALNDDNIEEYCNTVEIQVKLMDDTGYVRKTKYTSSFGEKYNPNAIKKGTILLHSMLLNNSNIYVSKYVDDHQAGDCVYMPIDRDEYFVREYKRKNEVPDGVASGFDSCDGYTFAHNVKAGDYVMDADFEDDIRIEAFCIFELQSDNTYAVSITRYVNTTKTKYDTYTLPTEYHGIPCTAIRKFQCTQIKNLTVPASYTKVEDYAFLSAWNLQSLTFEGHPSIGRDAFNGCKAEPVYSTGN